MYLDSDSFLKLERLTVVLYDKTSSLSSVNETRKELFCQKNRAKKKLPPTQDALLQHVRRTLSQAGIWTTSTQSEPVVPSPQDFAWTKVAHSWVPVWAPMPDVSRVCRELIKCACKGGYDVASTPQPIFLTFGHFNGGAPKYKL